MASFRDRESFIPYRRSDLVRMCLEDGRLSEDDRTSFTRFCEILAAFYHFRFQKHLELLKDLFAPLDPDSATEMLRQPTDEEQRKMEQRLVDLFVAVLESANYARLSQDELRAAFGTESLIPLNTDVDFDDYEEGRVLFFHRGSSEERVTVRRFFKKKERRFEAFERVVLMLKFKPAAHFVSKKQKPEALNFTPGKMYVYLYKKIPKFDIDILFPNVDVSMNWKDILQFGVPAVGALVPIVMKTLPNLLLIVGIIVFFTIGPAAAAKWGASEEAMNNLFPILTALLSVGFMLGSYAFKQYMNYKNKRLKFLKNVTDTLFFKSLDCNAGVFHRLVDEAEEEETKEIILVYYFLLTHKGLTKAALDTQIEDWMDTRFGKKLDFDIDKAFTGLLDLKTSQQALLTVGGDGRCHVLEIAKANELIDYLWDNVFSYNPQTPSR